MKKTYWKAIGKAISGSLGRFLSITLLLLFGSFALVGLKVSGPDMEKTANHYFIDNQAMHLMVVSNYGLSQADQEELKGLPDAKVFFGYMSDTTLKDSQSALRLFSNTEEVSRYPVLSGRLPQNQEEIALSAYYQSQYKLGDYIQIDPDKAGMLKNTTYQLVGFIQSSEIIGTKHFGTSTVGTGTLTGYGLLDESAFDAPVYTLARVVLTDLEGKDAYSDVFVQTLEARQKEIETLLSDNGASRLQEVKNQAESQIASGQEKIREGQGQLEAGRQALADAQKQIDEGQLVLDQAKADLEKAQADLEVGQASLAEKEQALAESQVTLNQAKEALEAGKQTLDQEEKRLASAEEPLLAAKAQLAEAKAALDAKKADLDAGYTALDLAKNQLSTQIGTPGDQALPPDLQAQLDAALAAIQKQEAELVAAQALYDQGLAAYQEQEANYQAAYTQFLAGQTAFQQGLARYQAQENRYQEGLRTYEEGKVAIEVAKEQLAQAQTSIQNGQETLAQKERDLVKAREELALETEKFQREESKAQADLAQAQADLQQAEKDLRRLSEPTYSVFNRESIPGGVGLMQYNTSARAVGRVGDLFPVVLYLVAALVTFTTMTRFVDEERTNMGLYKALGYTNRAIIAKFTLYGLLASLIGTSLGIILGHTLLPQIVANIIAKETVLAQTNLYIFWDFVGLALVLGLVSAVLPAFYVAYKALQEEPARLLLPKPPVQGASILLEKLVFIWRRLSFTSKVTFRNIFRYKMRMFMTIFGVGGAVALLFAGLGIQASIGSIAQKQYETIFKYNFLVVAEDRLDNQDRGTLEKILDQNRVENYSRLAYQDLFVEKDQGSSQKVTLMVSPGMDFEPLMTLKDRQTNQVLPLKKGQILLSEKLAKQLGVQPGDRVQVRDAQDRSASLEVAGLTEMYAGHYAFLDQETYEAIFQVSLDLNAYLVRTRDKDAKVTDNLASQLLKTGYIRATVSNQAMLANIESVVSGLTGAMNVLLAVSILLTLVILYNLTTINVAERIRELSTIKVLGFHHHEVTLYIYRETVLLSLVGIGGGLAGGVWLHQAVVNMTAPKTVMFDPSVPGHLYLIPLLVVVLILGGLGLVVNKGLKELDMLEALKALD